MHAGQLRVLPRGREDAHRDGHQRPEGKCSAPGPRITAGAMGAPATCLTQVGTAARRARQGRFCNGRWRQQSAGPGRVRPRRCPGSPPSCLASRAVFRWRPPPACETATVTRGLRRCVSPRPGTQPVRAWIELVISGRRIKYFISKKMHLLQEKLTFPKGLRFQTWKSQAEDVGPVVRRSRVPCIPSRQPARWSAGGRRGCWARCPRPELRVRVGFDPAPLCLLGLDGRFEVC